MASNDRVSEAVRTLMAATAKDRNDLAGVLNTSAQTVTNKLHGRHPWSLDQVDRLAEFFELDPADLFRGARAVSALATAG